MAIFNRDSEDEVARGARAVVVHAETHGGDRRDSRAPRGANSGSAAPKADAGVFVTASLAITFPFNLTVGIALYTATAIWLSA